MNILKSSTIYSFFTFISRIFGFIRDVVFANFLGTGLFADIFYVAFRFPNTFRRIFSEGALNSSFIPVYAKLLERSENKNASIFAGNVSLFLLIVSGIIVILAELFMPNFLRVLAPGFIENPDKFNSLVLTSRIIFPFLILITMCSIYSAILNAHGKFALSAALPIILNIILILSVFTSYFFENNILTTLSLGVIVAGILQICILIYSLKKNKIEIKFFKNFYKDGLQKFFKMFIPSLFSSGLLQINILVGTIIASYQASAVSYLYYADRIYQLPLALIGIALGIALLPSLSKKIKIGTKKEVFNLIEKTIIYALLLAVPASVALFIIPNIIIEVLFERGSFDELSTISTAKALKFFSLGLVAFILTKILTPIYFANERPKPPLILGIITIIINIALSIFLFKNYGFVGIAIATTVSSWFNVVAMYLHLYFSGMFIHSKKIFIPILVIIISSSFIVLLLFFSALIYAKLIISNIVMQAIFLILVVLLSILVYFLLISFYKPFSYGTLKLEFLKNE